MIDSILNTLNTLLAEDSNDDGQKTALLSKNRDPALRALAGKLSTRDILTLAIIGDAQPLPQKQLAPQLPMSQPTTSRTVTRLTDLGLISKMRIPDNQKEWQLSLTPLGETIAAAKRAFDADKHARAAVIASHYTDTELARFDQFLREIATLHQN